jgi:hypothetical protein
VPSNRFLGKWRFLAFKLRVHSRVVLRGAPIF